jgi:CRP-like cAMP-binding protein
MGNEVVAIRLLSEGDFFGEIGMIYKCNRSATVISRNYNTFSIMNYSQYRDLINEYPEFEAELK